MLSLYGFSKPGAHHASLPAVVADDVTLCALSGSLIARTRLGCAADSHLSRVSPETPGGSQLTF